MADDAKKSVDESAEQKGWAEQEQTEKPNSETEVTLEVETSGDATVEIKEMEEDKNDESEDKDTEKTSETTEAKSKKEDAKSKDSDEPKDSDADDSSEEDDSDDDDEDEDDDDKANVEISIELPDKLSSDKKSIDADFQDAVREQIENCKFEIISAIQENIHTELKDYIIREIRKVERRRRTGVIVRNILILILAAVVGYFSYCLYDAKYFDFMQPECERDGTCGQDINNNVTATEPEVVKDTAWYQRNYGYLFDSLKINLNADKVSAYYLYSDDYKVSEIQPSYLLAMAYNRLNSNITYDSDKGIMIPADDLRTSYVNLFGNANNFVRSGFTYDCAEFSYDRETDSFVTPSVQCNSTSNRQIIEQVDEIYEEGNVLYFLTTAAVYDKTEGSFYTFDNLFKPAVKNALSDELTKHESLFNHYQYSFKKVDNHYYFSDIKKLN